MKSHYWLIPAIVLGWSCSLAWAERAELSQWNPSAFADEGTLQFLTIGPKEGEHWSRVWLVVLDGSVYVRLGNRAARRVRENTTAPYVAVKIAGRKFDRVRLVEALDMAERVAEAMKEKYLSDFIFRRFEHPLTVKLEPAPAEKGD